MYGFVIAGSTPGRVDVKFTNEDMMEIAGFDCYRMALNKPDVTKGYLGPTSFMLNDGVIHEVFSYTPFGYNEARKREYPPIGDQLDALWKLITANRDKLDLGQSEQLLDMIQAVKDKYPKPPTNDIN